MIIEQAPLYGWSPDLLVTGNDDLSGVTLQKENWRVHLITSTNVSFPRIEALQQQWRHKGIRGLWLCQSLPQPVRPSLRISPTGWLIPRKDLPLFPLYLRPTKPPVVGLPAPRQLEQPILYETFVVEVLESKLRFFDELVVRLPTGLPIRFYPISCPVCREVAYGFTGATQSSESFPPDVVIESEGGRIPDLGKLNDFIFRSEAPKMTALVAQSLDIPTVLSIPAHRNLNGKLPSSFACPVCHTPYTLDFVLRERRKSDENPTNNPLAGWLPGPLTVRLPSPFWTTQSDRMVFNSTDF